MKRFGLTFGVFDINNLGKGYYDLDISSDNQLPIRIKSLGFSVSLLKNINFSLLVILAMILVGLFIYAIGNNLNLIKWK
jgi:hypothetical protein